MDRSRRGRPRLVLAILALSLLTGPASASECAALGDFGCYFAFPSVRSAPNATLLVFLRGHLDGYGGHVPAAARVQAAREAFVRFRIGDAARKNRAAALITGSSDLSVGSEEIRAVERALGARFTRIAVAAHSGGADALLPTLAALPRVDRILMLDDFYFNSSGPYDEIQSYVQRGAACVGFRTGLTESGYQELLKSKLACSVEKYDRDDDHWDKVTECLGAYMSRMSCR